MGRWSLSELEAPVNGHLVGADRRVHSVTTDSRQSGDGVLFVALSGEHFDGHSFIAQAEDSGAVAALVSKDVETSLPLLQVDDTQRALGKLGAYNRASFTGPVVAITGSSGKTTVKNMIHAVLSQRGNTLATRGNLNNEIGVPLTLLELRKEHEFAVVEMGAARSGDIAWLCELGQPSIAVLLNAMPAHLEGFGSVEAVASAKGEIFDGLSAGCTAIINADEPWAGQWRERAAPAKVIDYGIRNPAAICATAIQPHGIDGVSFAAVTPADECTIRLQLPGAHNVSNALAAIAVGLACKLSLAEIRRGLESVAPIAGRLSGRRMENGAGLIDDCYNANPGSVRAAIDVLAACTGTRTLILGAMKELGAGSALLHEQIGDYAKAAGLDAFWGVGPELEGAVAAFGNGGQYFPDRNCAKDSLSGVFGGNDTLLIKGSRGAGMELLLAALLAEEAGGTR